MAQIDIQESIYQKYSSFISKHFKVIVLILIGIQMIKGTALYQHAYARSQYLWSYENGFIKRGLVGTISLFLNEHNQYRLLGIINFLSYFTYFLFLYSLYRLILKNAKTIMQKMIALLFLSSPFIIAIGSLLGYFDALILTILIATYNFCDDKKIPVLAYLFMVLVAIATHELALFFVIIPLLFLVWMHPNTTNRKKYYLLAVTSLICIVYLATIYSPNIAFNHNLEERVEQYKKILSTKTGEWFFVYYASYALKNSFMHDFKVLRLGMLVPLLPIYGFFILVTNWIVLPNLLRAKKYMTTLLYLGACYGPLIIILVGWDVDRFVCLTIGTAYIVFLIISKAYPAISEKQPTSMQMITISGLSIIALLTYYPISENYAENETLLSKNKQGILLQYPDKLINKWKENFVIPYKNKNLTEPTIGPVDNSKK